MENTFANVRPIIPVCVLQEENVRCHRYEDTAIPELKPRGIVQSISKGNAAICDAVLVVVRQDQQFVIHRFQRVPVRISWPCCHPETTIRIHRTLHRIDQIRKHLFRRKKVDSHAGMHGHPVNRFFTSQKSMHATFQFTRLVRLHHQRFRQVGIVRLRLLSLSRCPDHGVAVCCHHLQNLKFALHHREVGLPTDKLQARSAAKYAVPIGCSIDVVPDQILLQDGSTNGLQSLLVGNRTARRQKCRVNGRRDNTVSMIIQVHAIQCQFRQHNCSIRRLLGIRDPEPIASLSRQISHGAEIPCLLRRDRSGVLKQIHEQQFIFRCDP